MSARILVVDDNPLNIKLLAARLTREYYVVETAADGYQALEAVAKQLPDLILLDVMMPGMDGFEVCRKLREDPRARHIPVVMVTALTDVSDRVQGLRAGADDFLSKPINEVALLARVRSLLRLKFLMDEWRLREESAAAFGGADPLRSLGGQGMPGGADSEIGAIAGAQLLYYSDDSTEHGRLAPALAAEQVSLDQVTMPEEVLPTLAKGAYEAVMLALRPVSNPADDCALQLIATLRAGEATRNIPIVMVADDMDIGRVARALELGATDYLLRPLDNNELLARVRTQIRQTRTYRRLRDNYERSLAMALTDPLTGAFNRRYLDLHLPRIFSRARTGEKPLSILYVDLDHFKQVNDTHGHPVGDIVLKELVRRLNQNLRTFDMVVRMGGEEFAVLMPETDAATAAMIGERLCQRTANAAFEAPAQGLQLQLTISIGVATMQPGDADGLAMLARADHALYKAKHEGRNRVEIAS